MTALSLNLQPKAETGKAPLPGGNQRRPTPASSATFAKDRTAPVPQFGKNSLTRTRR
jgi:hypothetical protein